MTNPGPAPSSPVTREDRKAFVLASQLSWAMTGALMAVVAGLCAEYSIEVRSDTFPVRALFVLVFGAVALIYTYLRFDIKVASTCDALASFSAYAMTAATYTYVMTVVGARLPLADARMHAADLAFGLDWQAYLHWLNRHPTLGAIMDQTYQSLPKQLAILVICCVVTSQYRRLQIFVLSTQICLLACGAGPALAPALGAYKYLQIEPAVDHPAIPLTLMNGGLSEIAQLRGAAPLIRLDALEGIVVFPSFHMSLAVFFVWAFWTIPVMRWVAILVNLAMAAATPLSGSHYFVDAMAGTLLAILSILAATRIQAAIDRYASDAGASARGGVAAEPAGMAARV